VVRFPEKAKPTSRKLRAKDRPLANDFVSEEEFDRLLYAWFGNLARVLIPGGRFLGVLGPSGSGKSSVVLAGLVPKLKAGTIEGSERWPVAILRPGEDPLKNLAAGVVPQFLPAGVLPDAAQVLKLIDDLRADVRTNQRCP
jgi:hypothetical protein